MSLETRTLTLTIDKGVQDRHGTVRDTGIWVDLLQYCVRGASVTLEQEKNTRNNFGIGMIKTLRRR